MRIDCERCPNRKGDAPCEGCVVDFVLSLEDGSIVVEGREGDTDGAVVVSAAEARAIKVLSEAGLLGEVRMSPTERAG